MGDATAALQAVRSLRRRIEDLEFAAVVVARSQGWSWRSVGDALGVSGQTVHRRHASEEVQRRSRRTAR